MTKKLKVMTVIGTRPEIIRLSEVIKKCDKYFDHLLVHTGQNWDYTLNQVFFDDLQLREPDFYLEAAGKDLGETIGNVIAKSYQLLVKERPDAILILGDTNSALCAIPAKRLKIPIFHMEAGNRCFDENLPEEINRRIVDHISDINLPYSEHARRYLISEGLRKEHIMTTGSPMAEIFEVNLPKIKESNVLKELKLEKDKYFVVSAHREENIDNDDNFNSLITALNSIAEQYKMPLIFSTHPRTLAKIKERKVKLNKLIQIMKPFGFFDYNRLQLDSFCVLSDSGTLAEETALLGFNGVSLRTSTERPEVLDKGSFILAGITAKDIMQAIELTREMKENGEEALLTDAYKDKNYSTKIVKIVQSYVHVVNRNVWRKS